MAEGVTSLPPLTLIDAMRIVWSVRVRPCRMIVRNSRSFISTLAIGQGLEASEGVGELLVLQHDAQFGERVGEPGPARVFAEDDLALGAHRLGIHDLVGLPVPQDAVLVDARLVGEGIASHHGLVELDGVAGEA